MGLLYGLIHCVRAYVRVCVMMCVAGTNDKAGSPYYIQKFVNLQAVKTQFEPLPHWSYEKRQ